MIGFDTLLLEARRTRDCVGAVQTRAPRAPHYGVCRTLPIVTQAHEVQIRSRGPHARRGVVSSPKGEPPPCCCCALCVVRCVVFVVVVLVCRCRCCFCDVVCCVPCCCCGCGCACACGCGLVVFVVVVVVVLCFCFCFLDFVVV